MLCVASVYFCYCEGEEGWHIERGCIVCIRGQMCRVIPAAYRIIYMEKNMKLLQAHELHMYEMSDTGMSYTRVFF